MKDNKKNKGVKSKPPENLLRASQGRLEQLIKDIKRKGKKNDRRYSR